MTMPSLDNQVQAWLASQSKTGINGGDYALIDRGDGNGPQIGAWNTTTLGAQPTTEQLAGVATAAATIATNAANAVLCDKVDAFRNARLAAGFADTGGGGTGKTFACDDSSIGRWTAMAASAQPFALSHMGVLPPLPAGIVEPTYQPIPTDNSIPAAMTASAVYALFEGRVMPWVAATVIYGCTMKNAILAGNPPADITQGWP